MRNILINEGFHGKQASDNYRKKDSVRAEEFY